MTDGPGKLSLSSSPGEETCIGLGSTLGFSISTFDAHCLLTIILLCRLDGVLAKQTRGAGNKLGKDNMKMCTSEWHGQFVCLTVKHIFRVSIVVNL